MKSFRRKDGADEPPGPGRNGERDFHKEKRSNETHASTTDPDARLSQKSERARRPSWRFTGHLLMENRNGLVVDARLTQATGTAEREAALAMLGDLPGRRRITVGADKDYDTAAFVAAARDDERHAACGAEHQRHIAARTSTGGPRAMPAIGSARSSASGSRRRTAGSRRSAAWRRPNSAGLQRVGWVFMFKAAAYNLIRLPRLLATG